MAVIVNNPPQAPIADNRDSGAGFLLAVIMLLIVAFLVIYYALPAIRNSFSSYSTAPQVNVPGRVDVNVHGGAGSTGTNPGSGSTSK